MQKEKKRYAVAENLSDTAHTLLICKATEAQTGYVDFLGIECGKILPPRKKYDRSIEFIGNSITAGSSLDTSEVPCGKGTPRRFYAAAAVRCSQVKRIDNLPLF